MQEIDPAGNHYHENQSQFYPGNYMSRMIFILVYWHGHPKNEIYLHLHCYFASQAILLPFKPKRNLFLSKKIYFLDYNHPTDQQHFNTELLCALQPL